MKRLLLILSLLLALVGGLSATLHYLSRLPTEPVAVIWDKEACAHCHMHVGEPHFAAQLQTQHGEILNFDDPGCLLHYREKHKPSVHAIYFRHLREDRWLTESETGFVSVEPSPMGYNLGAVPLDTPGAMTAQAATQRVLALGKMP